MPQIAKKALKLTTEIDIHAVSCPGVWLPGRGRCSLSVCLLGFHTRTNKLPPVFPLLYHEKFKFERTFVGVRNLSVLERVLAAETVYLELVQEEASGEAVLAVFESSVRDLLFPRPAERLSYSGVDLDLLMEPTRDFPGIISPKIEVSTRTSVSETRTPLHQCSQDNVSFGHAHNKTTKAVYRSNSPEEGRKGEASTSAEGTKGAIAAGDLDEEAQPSHASPRQKDSGRGVREEASKPRFVYRRPDDDLLSRIPSSPTRNTRYLGIPSRYLSRSTGNLSDLPRTSIPSRYGRQQSSAAGGAAGRTSSETEGYGGGGGYTHPRRRPKDDLAHRAHVTLLDPGERSHPSRRARSLSPQRRPTSTPPDRASNLPTSTYPDRTTDLPSRLRKDEDDQSPEEEEEDNDSKSHSRSHSNSRSPSPPASHASAPAAINRRRPRSYRRPLTPSTCRRNYDSDDDSFDDLYIPRRYERCLERIWCSCWCSLCTRYSHCRSCRLLSRPLYSYCRYRPSHLSYYPYHHHYYRPYSKNYLHNLDLIGSDDLNSSPPKKFSETSKVDENPDATSEDSDLFDSSQVEEIKEGINKKIRVSKRDNWIKTKKQSKHSNKNAKNVNGDPASSENHIACDSENEPKKTNISSPELSDVD